jgi:hypothetical protein
MLGFSLVSFGVTAQQGYGTVAGVIAAVVLLSAAGLAPFLWKQWRLEAHRPADSFHRCILSLSATSVQRSAVMNRVTGQRVDPRRFAAAKDWVGLTVDFTSQGLRCSPDKYTARRGVQSFFLGAPHIRSVVIARDFLTTSVLLRLGDGSVVEGEAMGGRLPLQAAFAAVGVPQLAH